jgi:2'-5' RNA ligase
MRTFIAIPLPAEAKALLQQIQEKLRSFGADVRWTRVESIHLTLKFLGEVDPAVIPQIAALLRAERLGVSFSLALAGMGGFPNLRSPRVLWCGLRGELDRLNELHKKVERVCARVGFEPEARRFEPHLTIGRVSGKRNLQQLLEYIKIAPEFEYNFKASAFSIYRSVLSRSGAVYSVLETIGLD